MDGCLRPTDLSGFFSNGLRGSVPMTCRRARLVLGLGVLSGAFLLSRYNYLLFHSLVELGAVAVAWSVFLLMWNAQRLNTLPGFVIVGIAYAFVGGLDLLHTLAYKGMGVFSYDGADKATQLWIAARYLEAGHCFTCRFPQQSTKPHCRIAVLESRGLGLSSCR